MSEVRSMQDANPVNPPKPTPKKQETLADRNLRAALEREEQRKMEEAEAAAAAEAERKNDGRKYDMEVEGFNIGDSLVRRMQFLDEKVESGQEAIAEEELTDSVEGVDDQKPEVDEVADQALEKATESTDEDDDLDDFDLNDEEDDFGDAPLPPVPEAKPAAPAPKEDPTVKPEDLVQVAKAPEENKVIEMPTQDEIVFDESDFDDLDLGDDTDEDATAEEKSADNNGITDEELNSLRGEIKEKLFPPQRVFNVATKGVSISRLINSDQTGKHAIDWPLMGSGKLISMARMGGPDIETITDPNQSRNNVNQQRDIFRTMYNAILSDKPEFDVWLKVTPYTDIDHLYMAANRSCFQGANYIPMSCTNEECNHIFLSDDVDIETQMTKFKDDAAKKRFYAIMNGEDGIMDNTKTDIIPLADHLGVVLREPSIYNAIFEQGSLDQKFRDKYEKTINLLTYVDEFFYLDGPSAYPFKIKTDEKSIVRNAKYRIAQYSKIIMNMTSDAYNIMGARISEKLNVEPDVSYCFPELSCPKCGTKIEESPAAARQILFSRHRLSLLTVQ